MPWEWNRIAETIPLEKRQHYESLFIRANMLQALPTTEKKSIRVDSMDMDAVLFKAFEETLDSFDSKYFETRLKRFKRECGDTNSFLLYFPGVNLHVSNADTNLFICRFRVAERNPIRYYDGPGV